MASAYKFNRVHPPLLKDYSGDVYSVPSELLRELIGTAEWTTVKPDTSSRGLRPKEQVLESRFQLTRNIYWTMFLPPEHFAEDIKKTVTLVSGVSEIQKHTMERDLEVSAGASGFGLSASVKASLKITDETTREWHKEQREEREQTFKGGHTYCTWMLVDELIIRKTVQAKFRGKPSPFNPGVIVTDSVVNCILGTYQDNWEDTASREVSPEAPEVRAAQEVAKSVVITLPTGKLPSQSVSGR